ncbi:MAG: TIGR00300 family protein, partial [Acidobacteria bacterium]|nr:TIGR00300 family protein [Acidobacteriota bacterium]
MGLTEIIEAEGHLIDSHIMERIFDTVVEYQGRFEVEKFHIGRTNSEASQLRMRVETPTQGQMDQLLSQLLGLGCVPVDAGDAVVEVAVKDRCAPEDFYSTTNHRTLVRIDGQWVEVGKQRMDATVVITGSTAECRKLRDLKAGERVVVGMRGIRVVPDTKDRDRLSFGFMSNEVSSERQVETAVQTTVAIM